MRFSMRGLYAPTQISIGCAGGGPGWSPFTAQRQVGDVGEDAKPLGAGEQIGEQRPGVEEAPLVRVVLDPDQVEPQPVASGCDRSRLRDGRGCRDDADTELELSTFAGHSLPSQNSELDLSTPNAVRANVLVATGDGVRSCSPRGPGPRSAARPRRSVELAELSRSWRLHGPRLPVAVKD